MDIFVRNIVLVVLFFFFSFGAIAAETKVQLTEFKPDLKDKASLQRGARHFMNYCAGCHGLQYVRYESLAKDLAIPADLVVENLIFTNERIGSLIEMPVEASTQKKWFGVAPPDLTLITRSRSESWLYSFLNGFYLDASRPYGYNNRVYKDIGMPNVLANLQGDRVCESVAIEGKVNLDSVQGQAQGFCTEFSTITGTGALTEQEFDIFVSDLVNFLVYTGEPVRLYDRTFFGIDINKRQVIGIYCLLFLVVFGVFAVLLNREYWKDVH